MIKNKVIVVLLSFFLISFFSCHLEDKGAAFLSVTLSQSTVELNHGETVTITATTIKPLDVPVLFLWYVNGDYQTGQTVSSFEFSALPDATTEYQIQVKVVQSVLTAKDSALITVNEAETPQVSITSGNLVCGSNDPFSFTAEITDSSQKDLIITWYLDDILVPLANGKKIVTQSDFEPLDLSETINEYNIKVIASNGYKNNSDSAMLTITDQFHFIFTQNSYETTYGQPLTINLSSNTSNPVEFKWYIDDQLLYTGTEFEWDYNAITSDMTQDKIVSLTVSADSAELTEPFVSDAMPITVKQQHAPQLSMTSNGVEIQGDDTLTFSWFDIQNGKTVELKALGSDADNDVLTWSWYKDANQLTSETSDTVLLDLALEDVGVEKTYTLKITASDGFTTPAEFSIVIQIIEGSLSRIVHIDQTGTFTLNRPVGSGDHEITFLFTNGTDLEITEVPQMSLITSARSMDSIPTSVHSSYTTQKIATPTQRDSISDFNEQPLTMTGNSSHTNSTSRATVGNTHSFLYCLYDVSTNPPEPIEETKEEIQSTLMAMKNITTLFGQKTVEVWAEDSCIEGSSETKVGYMTTAKAEAAAELFLSTNPGNQNDIYDWATSITGEEWGNDFEAPGYISPFISEQNKIILLFSDIDTDGEQLPVSGTNYRTGFFYKKDNYKESSLSYSNECIMLYLDAPFFAYEENPGSWNINDPWPAKIKSTMVHEFQHLAHFYRKIKKTNNLTSVSETWLNESCSLMLEDLLAWRVETNGPRGISWDDYTAGSPGNTSGRLPFFLATPENSLTVWNNATEDYSSSYLFGAWILRNYGGAPLLSEIINSSYIDKAAITEAIETVTGVERSFDQLIKYWYTASWLSYQEQIPEEYSLNQGSVYSSSINGNTFLLGSINLDYFKIITGGGSTYNSIKTYSTPQTLQPNSGHFIAPFTISSESLKCDIHLPSGVALTLIID